VSQVSRLVSFSLKFAGVNRVVCVEGSPLVFEHGRCNVDGREIFIQTLSIFGNAINVETITSTDDAHQVLADVVNAGGMVSQRGRVRVYRAAPWRAPGA
jgi:hypothetical protein